MGILEPHVGYRGGCRIARLTTRTKAIIVHNLWQARTALAGAAAARRAVMLISAPAASASVGPAWFAALIEQARAAHPEVDCLAVLDCGTAPGDALAALRHGLKAIRYGGPQWPKIKDIASQSGASVLRKRPPALDLMTLNDGDEAVIDACRQWLSTE